MPHPALCRILEKLGIPSMFISIIQSFHEGMSAKAIVGQEFTESIGMCNRLHQGCTCTMARVLFSFGAVVDDWRNS